MNQPNIRKSFALECSVNTQKADIALLNQAFAHVALSSLPIITEDLWPFAAFKRGTVAGLFISLTPRKTPTTSNIPPS